MSLFFGPLPPAPRPPTKLREKSETEVRRAIALADRLTEDQMSQLITWLGQHKVPDVIRMAAAPPPAGFGLLIQETTLRRMKRKFNASHITNRVQEMIDVTSDIEAVVDSQDFETAQRGILAVLHQKAFELSRLPAASKELETIMSTIVKLTSLEHKRQQLALQRERLQMSRENGPVRHAHHRVDLNIVPLNRTNQNQPEKISCPDAPAQFNPPSVMQILADKAPEEVSKIPPTTSDSAKNQQAEQKIESIE